jgi:uncharacterized C2H2 Zn-finger protein
MEIKYFRCDKCGKTFTQSGTLNRHINKKRCKGIEYSKMDECINLLKEQNSNQSKEIIKLKDDMKVIKNKINDLQQTVKQLMSNNIKNNNIKGKNITISPHITTNNNNNNNFYILPFGKEKYNPVSFCELNGTSNLDEMFKLSMYYKYFDLPENRNIYMKTLNDCYIKDNSRWRKQKDCDKFINSTFIPIMQEYLKNLKKDEKSKILEYEEIIEIENGLNKLSKNLNKKKCQAKEYLYENKDLVEEAKDMEIKKK